MELIVLFIILLSIISVVLTFLAKKGESSFTYRQRGALFSPAERSFLGVLDSAVSESYRVFGKVRVADVILPEKSTNRRKWQFSFNRISGKHFDYVRCCKDTLNVIAVIELDDKSHKRKKSQARDKFLDSACESASLTLVRFAAQAQYIVSEVREKIENAIDPPNT